MALPPDGHAGLKAVPLTDPKVSRTLGLIARRGRPLPAAAQLLHDLLVAQAAPVGKTTRAREAVEAARPVRAGSPGR